LGHPRVPRGRLSVGLSHRDPRCAAIDPAPRQPAPALARGGGPAYNPWMISSEPSRHPQPTETPSSDGDEASVRTVNPAAWHAAVAAVVEENDELLALLAK
jgi:hypothetical protein